MQSRGAEKYSYGVAEAVLPEEVKQRLKNIIEEDRARLVELIRTRENLRNTHEVNRLTGRMAAAKRKLEEMGGDTQERLKNVLAVYNPETDSRWFYNGFGRFEAKLFGNLIFGDPEREEIPGLLNRFADRDPVSSLSVHLELGEIIYGEEQKSPIDEEASGEPGRANLLEELKADIRDVIPTFQEWAEMDAEKKQEFRIGKLGLRAIAMIFRVGGEPLPVHELVVDDRGMGTGRSLRMLMDVVRSKCGLREAQKFSKNVHGVDLMQKNIDQARALFREGRYGFPEENLSMGNYLDTSDKRTDPFRDKKAHLIISMMHSTFYNTTEEEWCTFFKNVRDDLLSGGYFVFDTIGMPHFEPTEEHEARIATSTFEDYRSLYTSLWLNYCRINQRHMPQGIDLLRMPRYPLWDNTSSQGFYWREVPTLKFINHIIDKIGGGLRITYSRECGPQYYTKEEKEQFGEEEAIKIGYKRAVELGRKWIKDNGMEEALLSEIRQRIASGVANPDFILNRPGRTILLDAQDDTSRPVEERLLDDIAGSMAGDHYRNVYVIIERTDDEDEDSLAGDINDEEAA